MYYLQSRYYDPNTGRFINADVLASTGQGLLGNNMYSYCLNNPINRCDFNGMSSHNVADPENCTCEECAYKPSFIGAVLDVLLSLGTCSSMLLGTPYVAGALNNGVNYVYYTWLSSGESNLEQSENQSTYTNSYVTRWDRLDYAKQQTGDSTYGINAWRYNSEYSMHMYGWYVINPFSELGNERIDAYAESAKKIHIETHSADSNWKTRVVTFIFGLIGL